MNKPTGGVGSNQYQTRPGGTPPPGSRADGAALAASLHPDDVAWVFEPSPERERRRQPEIATFLIGALYTGQLTRDGDPDITQEEGPKGQYLVTFPVRCRHDTHGLFGGQQLMVTVKIHPGDVTRTRHNKTSDTLNIDGRALWIADAFVNGTDIIEDPEFRPPPWETPHAWTATIDSHSESYDHDSPPRLETEDYVKIVFFTRPPLLA